MTAKDALVAALYRTGHTQESAARLIGWNGQQISQRLARNSMRADELLTLMDAIGVDVTFTVRKTGEVLREHTGVSEYKDGEACELYVDKKGRYFMAEYHEDGKDRIRSVSPSVAAAFIEKYGTKIEKGPKEE